jgi:tetratricopeptide (TPR) repeat protein
MDEQNVEDRFVCVWLDNQLMRSEDYIDTQDQIRTIIKAFLNFKDSNQCVDFITDTTDAKIFFITTNVLGKILVPIIHFFEQVHSIYIFYTKKSSDEDWTKDYKKIKGIYNDITQICDRFKQDTTVTEDETESFAISFISSSDISSSDVKRQDPSFMYFQLLKDIILNDCLSESEEQTKADMIDYCRKVNIDSPNALDLLDQFEKDFIPELSIYWYTRECFLYKMLNKALWTPQPDVLYKLRYFIRHLHYQILSEASKQREQLSSMIVYRGQSMSSDQIEKLKRNVGGFLSFNNFLSTSLKRDVALNFLLGSEIGVLFEMQIDPTIQKFPIVNIEQISFLQKDECEQELLFAMGSVFRILRIDKQRDFYRVQLTLSDDIDEQLAAYTKVTRDQTRTFHSFLSLLRLMDELGQYSCVDQFAEMLRDDIGLATNSSLLAAVHHMFGSIYHSRGQNKEALNHYHQTLNIYLSNDLPADHPTLTPTYNNIGCVYLAQSDYAKALEYQQLALDCQLNSDDPQNQSIITYITNIGKTYGNQEKYSEAIVHYKRALDLQKQHFGENDSSLAETYHLISSAYRNQGDFEQAG